MCYNAKMEKHCLIRKFALCSVSMLAFGLSSAAYANPEGGQVVGGSATIESSGKKLDVHQHTDRAVIDWRSFDIQVDEHTQFHQPSSSAKALNRVNSPDPSRIAGKLSANGNVILINPNGVFFEGTSQVDVNGLIATTADIDNQDFMAGKLHFNKPGNPDAAVVNSGTITAKEAGLVALVAPNVANHGVINAKLGRVELASGDSVMADLYGDGLYELKVSDEVASQLVSNTGSINAEGGTIAITAAAGKEIVHSLVTIEGELKAPTIEKKGGKIIIAAEGSNAVAGNKAEEKGKKQGSSTVLIANAYLDASGRDTGEQGGEIEITADTIGILQNTLIDTSGHSAPMPTSKPDIPSKGTATLTADKQVRKEEEFLAHENRAGGSIKIGGDYLGKGETAAASYVYVDPNSVILNDATHSGDAGRTIVWSDDTTQYYGNVFARGGTEGGNGGFLETSGKKYLDAQGYADLTAADGYKKGTYLLDPADITIYGNVDPEFVSTDGSIDLDSDLQLWLDAADATQITLTYSNDSMSSAQIDRTGANTLETITNVNLTSALQVGAKIRIGGANGQTALASDTSNADTFTITAISYDGSKTIITTSETISTAYDDQNVYRGLVSQWSDKAGTNHATQTTASTRPLWVSNGLNGKGLLKFDSPDTLSMPGADFGFKNNDEFYANTLIRATGVNGTTSNIIGNRDSSFTWMLRNTANLHLHGAAQYLSGQSLTVGDWNILAGEVAFTNPNKTSQLYKNGASIYTNNAFSYYSTTPGSKLYLGYMFDGGSAIDYSEVFVYNTALSDNAKALLNQYQSAKWGIALTPPGTGGTEAAKAMASDGYSAFATDYLERLSATADIVLQADNTITLDLKNDALTLVDDRSITLQTTNGNISTASAGSILTNRTGAGGNISFNAGGTGNINIDHALTLTAQNGGEISFTAGGGNVNITDNFNLTTDNFNLTGTLNGTGTGTFTYQQGTAGNSLGVGTGGAPDITLSDALIADVKTAFSNYSFGRLDGGAITNYTTTWEDPVTFLSGGNFTNAVATTSDDTILVRAGGDVILDTDMATTSATANALVLSAGDDFLNNAGSDALSATNSRWLVYSDEPANNTRDGLLPSASEFNKTYAANAPATIGAGNRFIYATATQPTLVYQVGDDTVEYGDAYSGTPSLTYSSGLVGDDTLLNIGLTGTANAATSYNPGDNVGTYNNAMTATAGTLSSPLGYQYAFVAGDLDVTQAALTVNLDNKSREYGDANPALTATINGFKLTDDESDLDTAPTYSTAATQNSNVGSYAITGAGGADTNYTFSYVDGTLTVNKAALTVTANNATREYGDANPSFTGAITGFKLSDNVSSLDTAPTYSSTASQNSNVGSYAISGAGGSDANYSFNYVNGALSITKAPLLVALLDSSPECQVGQANPAFGLTYTGFKLSETQSVLDTAPTASTLADSNSTEGSYDITIAGGSDNNYDLQYTNPAGSLTVTALPVVTSQTDGLPNTVVMTSQNPTAATTGTVSAANNTGGEESTETASNDDNNDVSTSRSLKSKAKKALHGLVEIHPSLVRLFNLESNAKLF